YDGCLDVRAVVPTPITLALVSSNGLTVYAQTNLLVVSNAWEHLNFSMSPSAGDSDGRFVITLTQAGSVTVGYAFLEPGFWGQFEGLPVRKDVAQGLVKQGITVLRYGGSMVNAAGYRWTNMIGPRDLRPPYTGTWYPYASDGWGIPDFLNFCDAAGFLGVPDFNINEAPQDMADFIQYANGSTNTEWGAQRAADGHPQPYGLKYLELGNEERVDSTYYQKFQALAQAIWAADTNITLVVGDFSYSQVITNPFDFGGAASGITTLAAQQQILQLANQNNRQVWFDVHVWDQGPVVDPTLTGMFSYDSALAQIAGGANYKVVVFELNAENHTQGRALGNALAINAAERDGRLPIVTSANCLQPDGQNDNGWDQGLLFLNQSNVWLQPPGYVTQMYSDNYQPQEVWSRVADPNSDLDMTAETSQGGKQMVLKVVNLNSVSESAVINLFGFVPTNSLATVEVLSAPLTAVNTANAPLDFAPVTTIWPHNFSNNIVLYTFASNSVTTISFQGRLTPMPAPVLKHRYSFNGSAGSTSITDLVGGQNGTFSGSGGGLDGNGNLILDGTGGYVNLGPNLITGCTNMTVEAWVNVKANDPTYARLFDFGDTDSNGNGDYGMDFSPQAGGNSWFEVFNTDPGSGSAQQLLGPPLAGSGPLYVAVVYDPQLPYATIYTNGMLAAIGSINIPFSSLVDSHDYLGRSGYNGDPYLAGTIGEFRVWSGDMGAVQVAADYAAGPDNVDTNIIWLTNITLTVTSPIKLGQTVTAKVTANYQNVQGVNVASGNPSLQSRNPSVLEVGSNLTLTAIGPGTTTVVAGYGGLYATQTVTVLPLPVVLMHRYSFVRDASDSVGGPAWNGMLVAPNGGAAATINHGLILPGNQQGGFGYSGYVSLPAGILTNTSSLTVECWVTQNQANGWAEIWDFGVNDNENFALIPYPENNNNNLEVAFNPNNNDIYTASSDLFPNNSEQYVCLTYNNFSLTGNLYTNGALVATQMYADTTYCPGSIGGAGGTTENMLGNDVYGDWQFSGTIYEFRIWNGAMSSSQVLADYAAGPDKLPAISPSLAIAQVGNAIVLSWPANAAGYTVHTTATMGAGTAWGALLAAPTLVLSNDTYQITLTVTNQAGFYRLSNL
ncbi:MAG TPA: LamG-like jellyroll fold domain-containing protein, partial [Candidatus Acidoferrum sp.]|nr:LamG-like jellyroll fold domain-containing protein [Candidatus Acidoferrum sp.]